MLGKLETAQLSLPGIEPGAEPEFVVFHDESGTYGGKGERWLFHGMLILPIHKIAIVANELLSVRRREDFHEEIHFVELKKSLVTPKTKCAKGWIDVFCSAVLDHSYYYCLAVDTESAEFQKHNFPKAYIAYNFFAKVALVGAFSWFFSSLPKLSFRVVSDYKDRIPEDNFCSYLPGAVSLTLNKKRLLKPGRYPIANPSSDRVDTLPNPTAELGGLELSQALELLQLSDLVTSGVAQAVSATSSLEAKIKVATYVSEVLLDARQKPWLQADRWHRRLCVRGFPSALGNFFDPRLEVVNKSQEALPFAN